MEEFFENLISTWWGILTLCLVCAAIWVLLSALLYRQFFKRFYDVLLSGLAILVLSPLLLVLTVVGAIKMKGNPFFTQPRPGKRKKLSKRQCDKRGVPYGAYGKEKIFKLVKFRTMTCEKDENGKLLPDEQRLTKYGKFLRSTSLDELPELFNIFAGQMSIVGPRPLLVQYLPLYSDEQRHRHDVRPGLTGLAQVNGRNAIGWKKRFELDICYIGNISFVFDLSIFCKTILSVFKREGISSENSETMEDFTGDNGHMETPYFIIDKSALELNFNELQDALRNVWQNACIGYSYKTNSLPWLLRYFRDAGCYAEVVSDDEYHLAKKISQGKGKIIYNGPIKSRETFFEALNDGDIVNLDSKREVHWLLSVPDGKTYSVGLRVNFDLESMCPKQTACGEEGGRFGFCLENGEFARAVKEIQEKGHKVVGLHLHMGSKTRSVEIYKAIARTAVWIEQKFHFHPEYIDIGGGFFGGLEDRPKFSDYFCSVSEILRTTFDANKTKLIVEPGISLVGSPISFVTSVIDVKETTRNRFIVTDGSRMNIDPLMRKNSLFWEAEFSRGEKVTHHKQVICGYTCMEDDRLFVARDCKKLEVGDKIIYRKVGAYTMCLSPLFIKYFPPVYLKEAKGIRLIRNRWNILDYMAEDLVGGVEE